MKKNITAQPISREDIQSAMNAFLQKGGKIKVMKSETPLKESLLEQDLESQNPLRNLTDSTL